MDQASRSVLEVARSVLAELDLENVLERVLAAARELTGARYAALGVLNDGRTGLARFLTLGIDDETRAAIGELPRGRGVLGELIAHPTPLRLDRVGRHARSYGFPAGHPPMETFLGVPIVARGEPYGNLYLTEKTGGMAFTGEDEEAVVLLAEFAGVAIDHARRYSGARERRDELEQTVAALDATTQIAHAIGAETDLGTILELVGKRGRALVEARLLVIELVKGDGLVIASGAGEFPEHLIGERVPLADSAAGAAVRTQRTQRLEDELNRTRFEQHGLGQLGLTAQSGLLVPLVFRGRVSGVLVAIDRLTDGPQFTGEDERLLEAFAASAAVAVATAETVAAEHHRQRLAAAEDERRRWARELHDETLQGLAAITMLLSAAREEHAEAADNAITEALGQLSQEISNLRALVTDLRPAALDDFGVAGALEALAERVGRQAIEIDLEVDLAWEQGRSLVRHTPELEITIYRIVQESLNNAVRHGAATRALIEVHEDDTSVRVVVRDNGSGFDPGTRTDGFGLLGMRERAHLLDGWLEIESAVGQGTTVSATLPAVRRPARDDDVPDVQAGGA
jgi:signal transduction histidine kinase